MSNKTAAIIAFIIVYIVTTGISYTLFSNQVIQQESTEVPQEESDLTNDYQAVTFNQNSPKTEECPLNGAMYSKEQRAWWEKHRPLGVMIENHEESRPQSGISFADVTYETVAEGGITRFLSVYYCEDAGIIGPVRSARTYFLDFISEYGEYPLYAHVGGANTPGPANALGQIGDYGWNAYNDLNQFSIGFPTFWRDQNRLGRSVATEHTMYSNTSKLWEVAEKRELTNVDEEGEPWSTDFKNYSFKDDAPESERGNANNLTIEFWNNSTYFVNWIYDRQSNQYLRNNGGQKHLDRNTNKQVSAKNIVVLYMTERNANDGYEGNAHLLYGTKGTGKALIFLDGEQINGTWSKSGRTGRTMLRDSRGNAIKLNRGKIWFEIVATDGVVKVE